MAEQARLDRSGMETIDQYWFSFQSSSEFLGEEDVGQFAISIHSSSLFLLVMMNKSQDIKTKLNQAPDVFSPYIEILFRVEVVQFYFAPFVSQTGNDHHPCLVTRRYPVHFEHQWHQQVCQKEVTKMIASHVQLQVGFGQVFLGKGHSGVQDEYVQPGSQAISIWILDGSKAADTSMFTSFQFPRCALQMPGQSPCTTDQVCQQLCFCSHWPPWWLGKLLGLAEGSCIREWLWLHEMPSFWQFPDRFLWEWQLLIVVVRDAIEPLTSIGTSDEDGFAVKPDFGRASTSGQPIPKAKEEQCCDQKCPSPKQKLYCPVLMVMPLKQRVHRPMQVMTPPWWIQLFHSQGKNWHCITST